MGCYTFFSQSYTDAAPQDIGASRTEAASGMTEPRIVWSDVMYTADTYWRTQKWPFSKPVLYCKNDNLKFIFKIFLNK